MLEMYNYVVCIWVHPFKLNNGHKLNLSWNACAMTKFARPCMMCVLGLRNIDVRLILNQWLPAIYFHARYHGEFARS